MDVEALVSEVLNVSLVSLDPLGSLVDFILVLSHGGSNSNLVSLSGLICEDEGLLGEGSDRLGSRVEGEPLGGIVWVVVLDSESELTTSDILGRVQGSVSSHL